jgi:3-hydroxyisobutyrate dehydrogenase
MARNCLRGGFPLTVYNRTLGKTFPLRDAGAMVAESPAEVAAVSDVVVSCVTACDDVREVVLDAGRGVIAGVRPGATIVDCSTVSPEVARDCARLLAEKGAGFLDAPVSGGDRGAQDATLSIMVGGSRKHFDRARPVLDAMGSTVTYCGDSGAGYTVKLCNQVLCGLHILAVAEALKLAGAAGVDSDALLKAVSSGAAGSWMISNLAPKMVAKDDEPGFFVDYQLKDLRLARKAAEALGLALPGADLARDAFEKASQAGYGRCGTQALRHVAGT